MTSSSHHHHHHHLHHGSGSGNHISSGSGSGNTTATTASAAAVAATTTNSNHHHHASTTTTSTATSSTTNHYGPSGRSPFPAVRRSRTSLARSSLEGISTTSVAAASATTTAAAGGGHNTTQVDNPGGAESTTPVAQHSPFLHGFLRFSPTNSSGNHHHHSSSGGVNNNVSGTTGHWSPHRNHLNDRKYQPKTRFFEGNPTGGGTKVSQQQQQKQQIPTKKASSGAGDKSSNTSGLASPVKPASTTVAVDGIPVDHLRLLSRNSMVQSPSQAAFYASLLYSKTKRPDDGLLLAQAHASCGKYTACLRVLEESSILRTDDPWEGLLVASSALAAQEEWGALVDLLEDACRLPDPSPDVAVVDVSTTSRTAMGSNDDDYNDAGAVLPPITPTYRPWTASLPLMDDDEIGWATLKASIPHHPPTSTANSATTTTSSGIHPLASLCWWRGKAYLQVGSGFRAVVYWKRALKIDSRCQQAWEGLLHRHLLTSSEAYQLIQDLDFGPDMEWLRSLYLARIEMTPQDGTGIMMPPAASQENIHQHHPHHQQQQQHLHLLQQNNYPHQQQQSQNRSTTISFAAPVLDASAIPYMSPTPTLPTPAAGLSLDSRSNRAVEFDVPTHGNNNNFRDGVNPMQLDVDAAFQKLWIDHKLQQSPEVLSMAARRAYRRYDWKASLSYCESLAQVDPTLQDAAFCYVSTLVILGHKRVLFRLAHEWVEASPKAAQSWFAVGAYYYTCQRYHVAQRHFCRATRLDPQCTEAWIAFGCSFASCDESDQALASFRAAQRLSPGEHSSLLYMGMEYVRTNHLVLAHYFLQASLTSSGGDPLCLHELGVLAVQKGDHVGAIGWFQRALASAVGVGGGSGGENSNNTVEECIDRCHDAYWEPTLFNMGHAFRKTRRFGAASMCFGRCVALRPDRFSTYAALGFTKHLQRDMDGAIECYHQALSLKADDPFSTEMLNRALEEQATMPELTTSSSYEDDHEHREGDRSRIGGSVASSGRRRRHHLSHKKRTPSSSASILSPDTSAMWSASRHKDDSFLSEDMDVEMSP